MYNPEGDGTWAVDKCNLHVYGNSVGDRLLYKGTALVGDLAQLHSRHDVASVSLIRLCNHKVMVQVQSRFADPVWLGVFVFPCGCFAFPSPYETSHVLACREAEGLALHLGWCCVVWCPPPQLVMYDYTTPSNGALIAIGGHVSL